MEQVDQSLLNAAAQEAGQNLLQAYDQRADWMGQARAASAQSAVQAAHMPVPGQVPTPSLPLAEVSIPSKAQQPMTAVANAGPVQVPGQVSAVPMGTANFPSGAQEMQILDADIQASIVQPLDTAADEGNKTELAEGAAAAKASLGDGLVTEVTKHDTDWMTALGASMAKDAEMTKQLTAQYGDALPAIFRAKSDPTA